MKNTRHPLTPSSRTKSNQIVDAHKEKLLMWNKQHHNNSQYPPFESNAQFINWHIQFNHLTIYENFDQYLKVIKVTSVDFVSACTAGSNNNLMPETNLKS